MRRSFPLILVVLGVVFGPWLFGDRKAALSPGLPKLPSVVFLKATSGESLSGLFEGLSPNPLYTQKNVLRHTPLRCDERRGWIARLAEALSLPKVYATVEPCSDLPCAGSYWVRAHGTCPEWTCLGVYKEATYDPDIGRKCTGLRLNGTSDCFHNEPDAHCPCNWVLCNSCL